MEQTTTDGVSNYWDSVLAEIENKVGIRHYNLWFKNIKLISLNKESVNIGVPNLFVQKKIRDDYESLIRDTIKNIAKINPSINFILENDGNSRTKYKQITTGIKSENLSKQDFIITDNRKLKLENFIVGDCNRLAYVAALEVLKPGPVDFNTLFIHGSIGVGKTHLLQGIWNRLIDESSTMNAAYMPAESWTNEFVYSLKGGKLESFRKKYRGIDIFLVDDVNFLSNKKGVQEELLHTFNTLHTLSKRIVFASDAHPKLISQLKDSLVSRFMSGMIAKIERPNFSTALQILRYKALKIRKMIPENVLEFISEKFNDNVRSMESAFTTVLAYANINKAKVDFKLACDVLCEIYVNKKRVITLKDIEEAVISHCSVSHADIHSKNKTRNIAHARQLCMYIAKTLTDASYQEIGQYYGNKRHTTAIFAINKVKEKMKNDIAFRSQTEKLIRKLK
ncbi:MAG: chromosomal replication initiator protein DnaA [Candidatus Scalinduaceae bacterium]